MTAPFGIVAFAVATPFGSVQRVGAQLADGRIIDLRNAYRGALCQRGDELASLRLAEALIPTTTFDFVRNDAAGLAAAEEALAFAISGPPTVTLKGETLRLVFSGDETQLLPAIVPGKMLCAGRNYRAHQLEVGITYDDFPRGFVKVASSLAADGETIAVPAATSKLDYEAELALVIGRGGRDIPVEQALDHVYGYTVINDMSARDWQLSESTRGNHLLAKNFDGLGPIGPAIIPKAFVDNPDDLAVQLTVNGEMRQNARTSQMVFSVSQLISHMSKMSLEPGDVIATGTPEGVALGIEGRHPDPFLKAGDVIVATVEKVGRLTTRLA